MSITLPFHPFTGLRAIGFMPKSGRPIWPVMGGSGEGDGEGDTGDTATETGPDTSGTSDTTASDGADADTTAASDGKPETGKPKGDDLAKWQALAKQNEARAKQNKKDLDAANAKNQQTLDAIAQALGLKKGEAVDPAKQIEQLTSVNAAKDKRIRELEIRDAVRSAAGKNGGDAEALLDSSSFLRGLADLDPADSGFRAALTEAIKTAVKTNPKLAAAEAAPKPTPKPAPPISGGEFAGGSGEGGPITEDQLSRMTPEQISKAYAEGRLKHLM